MGIQVVILAAGSGKRMNSTVPKVLHLLAAKPLLHHVLDIAVQLSELDPIVVYGHLGKHVKSSINNHQVKWVEQEQQLGTAHALQQTLNILNDKDNVLVLYGDVPLISKHTLEELINNTKAGQIGMVTANLPDPFGYGRIKRNNAKKIIGIVEEKDANPKERKIQEINTGIYLLPAKFLKKALPKIKNNNQQNEFYLTDIIALAAKEKIKINSVHPQAIEEILGVNDRIQQAHLERYYQRCQANKLMLAGVTLIDPVRLDIRGEIKTGKDVVIDINVICEGNVSLDDGCKIGANSILRNVSLGKNVIVKPNSIIDGAVIANDCEIGPFARIRPDTHLASSVHIGNFVEIKKSHVGEGSKINHLTYVGDAEIGSEVNIGAGTITCNYDGVNKSKTIIGDKVFVGSSSNLVAPVKIGKGATIGAGSTITQDAPENKLTVARAKQITIEGWERPKKKVSA